MPLGRIEAAITRLEAAVQQPLSVRATNLAPALEEVQAANARLREAVGLTLRQIDAIIARHGADSPR